MSRIRIDGWLVCLAATLLGTAAFQLPAGAAADATTTAVLTQASKAHQALKAFSCSLSLRSQEGERSQSVSLAFAFRKPDQAKLSVVDSGHTVFRGVSSGKEVLVYSVEDKKYLIRGIAKGGRGATAVASASQSVVLKMYLHPEAIVQMLKAPASNAHFTGTASVDGGTVDLVSTIIDSTPRETVTGSFGFSHSDHLLRSLAIMITANVHGVNRQARIDEVIHNLSTAPHLASRDFAVSAPAGASEFTEADARQPSMHDPRIQPGATPFPIDATDVSGKRVTLSQYHGKVLLIDFWATWCGPCVAEIPNVLAVYQKYHKQGLEVIGFSQDQDRGALSSFVLQRGIPWRMVFCGGPGEGKVPQTYGIQAIPVMVLIGRDGKVAAVDMRGPALEQAVQEALARP